MSSMAPATAGTYLYGVADARPFEADHAPLTAPGIGGRGDPVRLVGYRDLVAIVSDSPSLRYDISRHNIMAHERVLEEVMARSDVVPVSFGMVAHDDEAVREQLLAGEFEELHHHLARVRGRVELSLKVLWERDRLFAEVATATEAIRALRDSLASKPAGTAYYERIELGRLTSAAIEDKREDEAAALLEELQPLAVETRVAANLTEVMVLNAAFLVEKNREQDFDAAIQELGAAQAGRLIFRYVGPLPPYSFADVRVRWT